MDLIRPVEITDSNLTSSNVLEDDYAEYVAGTTYVVDDYVIVKGTVHKVYVSLQAANLGNYPPDNTSGETPYWLEVGSTKPWRMFDTQVATQTEATTEIIVEIAPGRINSLAMLEVEAAEIEVTLTDPVAGIVYNETIDMVSDSGVQDLYAYFYEPIVRDTDAVKLDIPPYVDATLKVEIRNTGGTAKIGMMVVGTKKFLGTTKWKPQISILEYSRKETDDFGNPTLVVRKSARLMNVDLFMDTSYASELRRTLAEYSAVPVVWVGHEDYQSTIIYGFYRSFAIVLDNYSTSDCTLDIEGLI